MVIAPIFDNAGDFSDGCAVVQLDQKDYFINNLFSGKQDLITVGFSWTRGFSEGLAAVEINGKWGYVNTNGEMVISPEYYEACSFKDGLARVKTSDSDLDGWTYINKSGRKIKDEKTYFIHASHPCNDSSHDDRLRRRQDSSRSKL